MKHTTTPLLIAASLLAFAGAAPFLLAQGDDASRTALKQANATTVEKISIAGKSVTIKVPDQPAPGKPWLWIGEFGGQLKSLQDGLVKKGWHVVYVGVSGQFGSPRAMEVWEKVYEEMHGKRGLSAKPALLGISRGGLYVTAWTRLHPDRVSVLYLDNGVCDIRSWPAGFQLTMQGEGSPKEWALCKAAFGYTSDADAEEKAAKPCDGMLPAIQAGVFLISCHGTADSVVPFEDNAAHLVKLWQDNGGRLKLFPKEGANHHPHGLPDSGPLIATIVAEGSQSPDASRNDNHPEAVDEPTRKFNPLIRQKTNKDAMNQYNVVWTTPSQDMHGSMPIGNGDLAANFWVEPSGDLLFYLSKSDSWDADQELLKLGRVRIRLDKPFVRDGRPFRQELDLARGCIVVESGTGDDKTTVDFWIDANRPVINVDIKGAEAFTAQVILETWRDDTILPPSDNAIQWYHRNTKSIFSETLKNQHLGHAVGKFRDPLIDLTFGGLIAGEGLVSKGDKTLATAAPVTSLNVRIHALTAQTPDAAAWVSQLGALRSASDKVASAEARPAHELWWKDFWNRSWIFPEGTEDAKAVGRAYALQRWIQAGAGRGAYPIKFNGSLFTVDGMDFNKKTGEWSDTSPDWRKWGGCYWFQNTREPYWAMLYSGDYGQMEPLWKMYREALPLLKERTKTYFHHDGIYCSETMHPWGLNKQGDFGNNNPDFYPQNGFVRRYWDSGNELSQMMLDFYEHTGNEEFAKNTMIPIADGVVTFYEQHYPKTEPGKPRFAPAMSLETYHTAEDPLPVIVGLRTVLTRLLELPESLTTPEQRVKWSRFLAELPETPMAEENGKKWMLPARTFSVKKNSENPELYAVFPYRAYGLGKPDLEVAHETWNRRVVKATGGWRQDSIQAALLGLADEAKKDVVKNATHLSLLGPTPPKRSRFPAFWGPNLNWVPDQDHGSVIMIALQRMLMQCDGDTIRLVPAWPKDWNANFKLHAPKNTTVEGRVENGKLTDLKVTPESRRKDVVIGAE